MVEYLEGGLADARVQIERELVTLQRRNGAEMDMPLAAVRDRTRLQLFLDAERQKCQRVERTITSLRTHVRYHSTLVDIARDGLHSGMRHGYESCLQSILAQVAGRIWDCGAAYHSDVDTQLGAYESTVLRIVHSILASLDRSLEDLPRDDAPADS